MRSGKAILRASQTYGLNLYLLIGPCVNPYASPVKGRLHGETNDFGWRLAFPLYLIDQMRVTEKKWNRELLQTDDGHL
jgi:hypothetical protein